MIQAVLRTELVFQFRRRHQMRARTFSPLTFLLRANSRRVRTSTAEGGHAEVTSIYDNSNAPELGALSFAMYIRVPE